MDRLELNPSVDVRNHLRSIDYCLDLDEVIHIR